MLFRITAQDQHRQVGRTGPDRGQRIDAALIGHRNVHHDHVDFAPAHDVQGLAPFAASATTLKSGWSAKNWRSPARTIAWSSTIAIRIMLSGSPWLDDPLFAGTPDDGHSDGHPTQPVCISGSLRRHRGDGVRQRSSYRESVQSLDEAVRITSIRGSIQALAQGVLDAESGQRGYLLTDRKEYLEPMATRAAKSMKRSARSAVTTMKTRTRCSVPEVAHLTAAKLAALAESIRLHDEGKVDAATEIVLSEIGKGKMEAIRTVGAELMAFETTNRDETRANIYRSLMLGRIAWQR